MPQLYSNEGSALLQSDLNPSDTTTTLAPGEGDRFPLPDASDPDSFAIVTIEDNNGFYEIAKLTERSGDILTLERAQEDTSALGFTALVSRIETRLTSGTLSNFVQQSQKFELRGTDVEVDNIKLWHNTDPSTYQYFRLQYTDVFTAPTMLLTPPAGVNGTSVAIGVINDEGGQDTLRLGPVNDSVLSGKGAVSMPALNLRMIDSILFGETVTAIWASNGADAGKLTWKTSGGKASYSFAVRDQNDAEHFVGINESAHLTWRKTHNVEHPLLEANPDDFDYMQVSYERNPFNPSSGDWYWFRPSDYDLQRETAYV